MKLLVISDTHNSLYYAKMVIERIKDKIDGIIHLGDHDEDAIQLSREYPLIPIHYIAGNCDFGPAARTEKIIEFNKKRILITHGHKQHVKWGYDRIGYFAAENSVDAVLFGHTHIPYIDYYGHILLMNPGSLSEPRMIHTPTYGVLDISSTGIIEPAIMTIENNKNFKRLDF
jgi:putative phosphoesterase